MKIAFFTDTFYPSINGVVTSLVDTAEELTRRGHEVLVVAPSTTEKKEFPFQVHYAMSVSGLVYPDFRIGLPNPNLLRLMHSFEPDIIHTHVPFSIGWQGVMLGKHLKVPLVATHHTYFTDEESLKSLGLPKNILLRQFQKTADKVITFYFNQHDVLIAPSRDTLRDLEEKNVVPPAYVIPSPVQVERFQAACQNGLKLRKKYGISKSILYVGRISGEKNIDLVLRAFAEAALPKDVSLVLIGDGVAVSTLQKHAKQLGISDRVVWVGRVVHQQLLDEGYYYLGDVFVSLSCFETLGLSTIEAMACGLPVIGARSKATVEVVRGAGVLVEAEDTRQTAHQLHKIFSDSEYYHSLSEKSLKRAARYSPQKTVTQLEKLYSDSIEEKGSTV